MDQVKPIVIHYESLWKGEEAKQGYVRTQRQI